MNPKLIRCQMLAWFGASQNNIAQRQRQLATGTTYRLVGLALLLSLVAGPAWASQNVTGVWYDDSGTGAVQLYRCGNSVCGRIFWLRHAVNKAGKPLRDAYNPSHIHRKRPICGLQVIWGTQPQNDGSWDGGRIYDPKVGKSYAVAIERLGATRLRITGYLGARLFGKSFVWRRAPANLQKCRVTG